MRVYILLILVLPVAALRGSAQCPGNDSIWKQMQELEHTPSLPVKQQLNRLLGYEKILSIARWQEIRFMPG